MEPDVIRMYSSSPPPMEDGGEEDEDEFSDFTGVPNSVSFTEFDTPTTFNQLQALNATSPPELITNGRIVGIHGPSGTAKSNGALPSNGQGDVPACRTISAEEIRKVTEHPRATYANLRSDVSENDWTGSNAVDCNGGGVGVETLTNGFATFDTEGVNSSCKKHRETEGPSVDYSPDAVLNDNDIDNDNDDDFADFSAFSNADISSGGADWEHSNHNERPAENHDNQPQSDGGQGTSVGSSLAVDNDKDACVTGFASLALTEEASDGLSNGDWGFHAGASFEQRDLETDNAHQNSTKNNELIEPPLAQNGVIVQNGLEVKDKVNNGVSPLSEDERGSSSSEPTEEKGSGNDTETETETETSFGRPLSTDALEEFGDFSTTGSVPSPPLQEETATPADHSQLAEDDDDEDFGDFSDFGEAGAFGGAGFADFDAQQGVPSESAPEAKGEAACPGKDEEFGDFDSPKDASTLCENEDGKKCENSDLQTEFPGSDSFADFSSAPVEGDGWRAFNEPDSNQNASGESWAAFGEDQSSAFSEKLDDVPQPASVPQPPSGSREHSRKDSLTASLVTRLEKLFLVSFPEAPVAPVGEEVPSLKAFLQPSDKSEHQEEDRAPASGVLQDVWRQLQDIHNAFGLRHQWGGSHSNKTLLCSLGIDTRNILFTGQKKQPVIVPMYAASLGMLEPTKEPVKPVSAAEMIASIAQSPSVSADLNTCPSDTVQESLPPVQFDWSSSGLTNPLDGVDPELYELTQAKLEVSGGSSRVADAFARLMSTVEKTNTSTRKLQGRKEENLSEEARRVIAGLPDLSFMQAKVLMFPSTLTPLPPSSSSSSPSPVPD
ncbi:aftiphilin a isoform X2 [Astyanax mexicanus]|uniref:aftiphilin a isoform X2 n=1 Tax=Astyanax mexicanus TaxID=7994 RepID=UPI0020CB3B72|nr:aftiphilin a isoform X2 [Astyanax mexicanus]